VQQKLVRSNTFKLLTVLMGCVLLSQQTLEEGKFVSEHGKRREVLLGLAHTLQDPHAGCVHFL